MEGDLTVEEGRLLAKRIFSGIQNFLLTLEVVVSGYQSLGEWNWQAFRLEFFLWLDYLVLKVSLNVQHFVSGIIAFKFWHQFFH